MGGFRTCVAVLALLAASGPARADPPAGALTADGLGALRIGMAEAELLKLAKLDDRAKIHGRDWSACHMLTSPDRALGAMIEDGKLSRLSIARSSATKTDSGIGVGSTEAEVKAAYGGLKTQSNPYRDPPWHDLYFQPEGPKGRGLRFMIDDKGKVFVIHAGERSIWYSEDCD